MTDSDAYLKVAQLNTPEELMASSTSIIKRQDLSIETPYISPANEAETQLVDIWKDVLCIDSVGIDDNFFELGGDSLGMTQIILTIRTIWNISIAIDEFFEVPTVRGLSTAAERQNKLDVR